MAHNRDLQHLFRSGQLKCSPMSPIELFNVINGSIGQNKSEPGRGTYYIDLALEAFDWEEEIVNTSIRLDFINFEGVTFEELEYKRFKFPLSPEEGYIDGSVYIESTHNPIDVQFISFGNRYKEFFDNTTSKEDYIVATILYRFCWEGEEADNYPETKRANVILKYLK